MPGVLQELSDAMANAAETVGQSIVRVEGRKRLAGTGVVWSADGVIVTAHHVVHKENGIEIGLPDGSTASATLVGRDPSTDLAVLRAETHDLAAPAWGEIDGVKVGQLVLALGRPGQFVQATLGVVSALGQGWRTPPGGQIDRYLQTDVLMYPGFSGGSLVSAGGEVIGLNSSALLRGVSVAVPVPTVRRVVESLLQHGHVRRGYLGVAAQVVRLPEALQEQLGQETGVLLVSVETGGAADQGGLALGDTIVALDGQPVRHMDDLLGLLTSERIGVSVPVQIVRGGQVQEMQVTVGEHA